MATWPSCHLHVDLSTQLPTTIRPLFCRHGFDRCSVTIRVPPKRNITNQVETTPEPIPLYTIKPNPAPRYLRTPREGIDGKFQLRALANIPHASACFVMRRCLHPFCLRIKVFQAGKGKITSNPSPCSLVLGSTQVQRHRARTPPGVASRSRWPSRRCCSLMEQTHRPGV